MIHLIGEYAQAMCGRCSLLAHAYPRVCQAWDVMLCSQYLALDASAVAMMKGVAKCDKHYDQQCSVKQVRLEYALHFYKTWGMSAPATTILTSNALATILSAKLICSCVSQTHCLQHMRWVLMSLMWNLCISNDCSMRHGPQRVSCPQRLTALESSKDTHRI